MLPLFKGERPTPKSLQMQCSSLGNGVTPFLLPRTICAEHLFPFGGETNPKSLQMQCSSSGNGVTSFLLPGTTCAEHLYPFGGEANPKSLQMQCSSSGNGDRFSSQELSAQSTLFFGEGQHRLSKAPE